jgi:ribonuclease BN (tRNA processing enzyme)
MRLTTIGTGTTSPHPARVCSSQLVESGPVRLLLDCGFGAVHRMATLRIDWQTITHIALTHFHADHVGDLPLLVMAWRWGQLPPRAEPVTLYGPPGTGAFMEKMAAVYGGWLLNPGFPFTVRELAVDEVVRFSETLRLTMHPVPHTPESVAYCIDEGGRRIVYTGDTSFDEAIGEWAADCDLLLTECSLPDNMAVKEHLTPSQAGALAAAVKAKRLVLTHFYPPVENVDIEAEVLAHYAGPVLLATDGWSIEL